MTQIRTAEVHLRLRDMRHEIEELWKEVYPGYADFRDDLNSVGDALRSALDSLKNDTRLREKAGLKS